MVVYHNSNIPKWMTSDSFDKNFKPFSTKMIEKYQELRMIIKNNYPLEQWYRFGLMDKR